MTGDNQDQIIIGFEDVSGKKSYQTLIGRLISAQTAGKTLYLLFENGQIISKEGLPTHLELRKLPASVTPLQLISDPVTENIYVLCRKNQNEHPTTTETTSARSVQQRWLIYQFVRSEWKLLTFLPDETNQSKPYLQMRNNSMTVFVRSSPEEVTMWNFENGNFSRGKKNKVDKEQTITGILNFSGKTYLASELSASKGKSIYLVSPLTSGKTELIGPLKGASDNFVLKYPYAIASDEHLVYLVTIDAKDQLCFYQWDNLQSKCKSVEVLPPGSKLGKDDKPSILFPVLMTVVLFLALFTRGFSSDTLSSLPPKMILAQFWRRGLAFMIDYFPLLIVGTFFWQDELHQISASTDFFEYLQQMQMNDKMITFGFVINFVYVIYCVILEGIFGWTIGKWLMHLEVRKASAMAVKPTWIQVIIRNILKIVELNFLPVIFVIFFTRSRQRIGDMVAGTVVLQKVKGETRIDDYA
jgi:uncharacterized RDD family membrane protein YckC